MIAVMVTMPSLEEAGKRLAAELNIPFTAVADKHYQYLLTLTDQHLELRLNNSKSSKPLYVDLISGKMGHRLKYGGGKGQLIARAVGLTRKKNLSILDVTAGLGRDAFVLASLHCKVIMIERSKIIAALLADGLYRAKTVPWAQELAIDLLVMDANAYLKSLSVENYPDVIYLDPMFPQVKKSALVKKEMRILRDLVGEDLDATELLTCALTKASYRVVVKRARLAPALRGPKPTMAIVGKSSRYDVYVTRSS